MKSILTFAAAAVLIAALAACSSGDVNETVPLETATAGVGADADATTSPPGITPAATTTPDPQSDDDRATAGATTSPPGITPVATTTPNPQDDDDEGAATGATGATGGTTGASPTAVTGSGELRVGGMLDALLPEGTEDVVRSIEFDLAEGTLALRTVLTNESLAEQMCSFVSGRVLFFTSEVDIQDASGNSLAQCTFDEVRDVDVDLASGSVTITTTWTEDDRAAAEDLCASVSDTFLTDADITVNSEDGSELVHCEP